MKIIAHRGYCGSESRINENSIKALYDGLLNCEGIETDLRFHNYHGLYISHDHLKHNEKIILFSSFIKFLEKEITTPFNKKKYLFLNIKEDNLAENIDKKFIKRLKSLNIHTFFFDMSNPDFLNYIELFPENIIFRISELESSDYFQKILIKFGKNKIKNFTFWVDTFWGFNLYLESLILNLMNDYPLAEFIIVDPKLHNQKSFINDNLLKNKRIFLLKDL